MKRARKDGTGMLVIVSIVFTLCGILMLFGGICSAVSHVKFFKNASEITGIISRIETSRDSDGDIHHAVYVSYNIDNISYEDVPLHYYASNMFEGDTITLYYNAKNPNHVETKSGSSFEVILLSVLGLVFATVGIGVMIPVIRQKKLKKLKKTGRCIRLPITRIEVNGSIRVNGVPAHYVICEETNPTTGRKVRYQSSNYFTYLDNTIQAGDIVPIYIDPNDSERYYIDVDNVEPGNFTVPESTNNTIPFNSDPIYNTSYADNETAAGEDNYNLNSSNGNYNNPF